MNDRFMTVLSLANMRAVPASNLYHFMHEQGVRFAGGPREMQDRVMTTPGRWNGFAYRYAASSDWAAPTGGEVDNATEAR